MFKLGGADYGAAPVKLERKKIYGWTDTVATDKDGNVCGSAYLSPDDALVIPSGGLQQATVDSEGRWVKKSELTAYSEDGQKVLPTYASSFDAPIELKEKATKEEFLDNDWESVYQLVNADLAAAVGDDIYKFEFNYTKSTNHNDGYQIQHVNGLTYDFLFDMAKKLAEADSMMLVGGGQKGIDPLVMANGGPPIVPSSKVALMVTNTPSSCD